MGFPSFVFGLTASSAFVLPLCALRAASKRAFNVGRFISAA